MKCERGNFVCLCNDKFNHLFECKSDYQMDYFRVRRGCQCTYSPALWLKVSAPYKLKKNGRWKSSEHYAQAIKDMKEGVI